MKIHTTRFAAIEIEPDDILFFRNGLLGFEDCRHWVLLADADNSSVAWLQSMQHAIVLAFVADPINNMLLMALCATLAYHSYLGVQVVIEDYVHAPRLLWFSLLLSRAVHLAVGLLLVYTVYDIGFGA